MNLQSDIRNRSMQPVGLVDNEDESTAAKEKLLSNENKCAIKILMKSLAQSFSRLICDATELFLQSKDLKSN